VREGEAKGPLQIAPVRERGIVPSGAQEARFARLKKWRDAEALSEGVESSMVMTTEALRAASLAEIRSVDDLVRLGLMRNWQFRRYGQTVYARLTSVS
jgi:ribonuclease D